MASTAFAAIVCLFLVSVAQCQRGDSEDFRRPFRPRPPRPQPGNCTCPPPRPHPRPHHNRTNLGICDTNGVRYNTTCDLINAQAVDQSLGGRPCNFSFVEQAMNNSAAESEDDRRPDFSRHSSKRHHFRLRFCLNNNETVYSKRQLFEALKNDTSVGVRCFGRCPCELRCPSPKPWGQLGYFGMFGGNRPFGSRKPFGGFGDHRPFDGRRNNDFDNVEADSDSFENGNNNQQ